MYLLYFPESKDAGKAIVCIYCYFQKQKKQEQLLSRLQVLLHSPTSDPRTLCEVLDYFLRKLSSSQSSNRDMAVKVGRMLTYVKWNENCRILILSVFAKV